MLIVYRADTTVICLSCKIYWQGKTIAFSDQEWFCINAIGTLIFHERRGRDSEILHNWESSTVPYVVDQFARAAYVRTYSYRSAKNRSVRPDQWRHYAVAKLSIVFPILSIVFYVSRCIRECICFGAPLHQKFSCHSLSTITHT